MRRTVDLDGAVTRALRAPSVHNTQPWRWRIGPDHVELHADWTRHLPWTDPDRRDLVLSCGTALHHLRVALAAQGVAVRVARLPDPDNAAHLATVTLVPGPTDTELAALFPAITRRRTDRRRMAGRAVPTDLIRACTRQAEREGARLIPTTTPALRERLAAAIARAGREQAVTPGYAAELDIWTSRYAASRDGVPASNVPPSPIGLVGSSPLRRFPRTGLAQPRHPATSGPSDDAAELLVLAADTDDELAWLRAGEATSAVLLAATQAGLATTPLSQAIEVHRSRRELRHSLLRDPGFPQLVIRIGWPVGWPAGSTEDLPLTPRRELRMVRLPK